MPTINDRQALARVEATFGLINSVPNVSMTLTDDELRAEFTTIALAALMAPAPPVFPGHGSGPGP